MRLIPRRRRRLNVDKYTERWKSVQLKCGSRKSWPQAIIEADDLLNDVLKRCHYKGKSTGARLVAAQRSLSSNETVWAGHKLRNQVSQEDVDVRTLKKQDMMIALAGFRQALRDLGALET